MKETKSHAPVFRGSKPNSTTVCAYCPKCDTEIKEYRQKKCDKCGWEIYWMPFGKPDRGRK